LLTATRVTFDGIEFCMEAMPSAMDIIVIL